MQRREAIRTWAWLSAAWLGTLGFCVWFFGRSVPGRQVAQAASDTGGAAQGAALFLAFALFGLGAYFLPVLVAAGRRCVHTPGIFVLNFFLGWTILGWVGALIWAVVGPERPPTARP